MSDLISREAAIAAIETAEKEAKLSRKGLTSAVQTVNRAICVGLSQAVLEVSAVPSPWVSVKDKLPKIGQEVLVWHCAEHEPLSGGSIELATYKPGEDFGEKYAWSGSEYDLPLEDVTHWMELPTPPYN